MTDLAWRYDVAARRLWNPTGVLVAEPEGSTPAPPYSGRGDGLNNPAREQEPFTGPIPRGLYVIGPLRDGGKLGPNVMNLSPLGWNAYGRMLFRIHGDNAAGNFTASDGCLILGPRSRLAIGLSGIKRLMVV